MIWLLWGLASFTEHDDFEILLSLSGLVVCFFLLLRGLALFGCTKI